MGLAITRKVGQSIIIDTGTDKIEIVVKDINGKQVMIGINAPRNFQIDRPEYLAKKALGWDDQMPPPKVT